MRSFKIRLYPTKEHIIKEGMKVEKLQFKVGTKDESIRLRLTKEEKKIIKDLAAEKGLTLTDLVKYAINKVIEE